MKKRDQKYMPLPNDPRDLIYQVLDHLSAGRVNTDLIKIKLIKAAKLIPGPIHMGLAKYD